MKTYKILGLLLSYPTADVLAHMDDLMQVLESEQLLPSRQLKKIKSFAASFRNRDIYDIQEEYVELFDRGRSHCLQLFEHIHGESRDRGQAMVNLVEAYAEKGLYISAGELPDYLPLFLEFLSLCPADEAQELLGDPINVIAGIGVRLKKRGAPYAVVFESLQVLSKVKPDAEILEKTALEPLETLNPEDIDKEWEEANAFDNSDVDPDACNSCNAFPGATEELQKFAAGTPAGDLMNGGQ